LRKWVTGCIVGGLYDTSRCVRKNEMCVYFILKFYDHIFPVYQAIFRCVKVFCYTGTGDIKNLTVLPLRFTAILDDI
jgi:hypothetical protein